MQRHHTGSGRRRVIPTDWSAHHRPLLASTRDVVVALTRPSAAARGAFDQATGKWAVTPAAAYYSGPARVQLTATNEKVRDAAEQQVSTLTYQVTLSHDVTGVEVDDLCLIVSTDDNGDTDLVGRGLTVDGIGRGSLHWERVLYCNDNLEAAEAAG